MGFFRRMFGGRAESDDGDANSQPYAAFPVTITRPFDAIEMAQAAFSKGDHREAERWFRRAVEQYRAKEDAFGTAFALGRLGDFYQEKGRTTEAIKTYELAVSMNTDIPAVYTGLMSAYAESSNEDALFRTAAAFARNVPKRAGSIPDLLVKHSKGRLKAGDAATAERWLLRTEDRAARNGDAAAQFAVWGQRGLIVEKSGDLERAVKIYEAAVKAGSTDRVTYTRLLMAHERSKRWEDLLSLARRALGIQREASWEEDLRNRIARAEARQKPSANHSKATIPAFSVRHGADRIELIDQLTVKRGASRIAMAADGQMVLVSAGSSKPDNLSLIDLSSNQTIWTRSVLGASAHVLTLQSGLFLVASDVGKVGDGRTELVFLRTDGELIASATLPDKLSEVRTTHGLIAIGCRDGHLYAFDTKGRQLWRYRVPSRDDLPFNQPSSKSCPYFIQMSADGQRVLFSSWDTVFMLDSRGKLRWTWRVPTEPKTFTYTFPLEGRVSPAQYYKVLGVSTAAPLDEVRRAFRRRAMDTHPDRHPDDPHASSKFREAVQAYEAIVSGEAVPTSSEGITVEVSMAGFITTIYGMAVSQDGQETIVAASDGGLTYLDAGGRPTRRLVASEGAGHLAATPDLQRVVYSHWQGFNFYSSTGLLSTYPEEQLYQLRMSPDGRHIATWNKKQYRLFSIDGQTVAELEFARNISDVAFASSNEMIVAAGKLIRLSIR